MKDMEKKLAFLLANSPHFMLKGGSSTYEKAAKDFIANGVMVREKGEWKWRGGIPWCSNCGKMPPDYSYDGDSSTTDFCPNCGTDMRKEKNG